MSYKNLYSKHICHRLTIFGLGTFLLMLPLSLPAQNSREADDEIVVTDK